MDLVDPYYLGLDVTIMHMMVLSWGGDSIERWGGGVERWGGDVSRLMEEKERSLAAIHSLGVVHQDVRGANLLWNSEVGRVMVIDFERSDIRKVIPGGNISAPELGDVWNKTRLKMVVVK